MNAAKTAWPQSERNGAPEARLQGWEEFEDNVDRIVSFEY